MTRLVLPPPRHVAIIMDGNGRWAKSRYLPRAEGHRQGVKALNRITEAAVKAGIAYLTVFAFSSENWRRPATEVSLLMTLFAQGLASWSKPLCDAGVRLRVIGDKSAFPEHVRTAISECEAKTAEGTNMTLNIAANYGGRWDMTQAAQKLVEAGLPVTEEGIDANLALKEAGDVDLMIRTGGEQRISNFILWQAAYSELYFSQTLWPDFDEEALNAALRWFEGRERRFGMTSEQIARKKSTLLNV